MAGGAENVPGLKHGTEVMDHLVEDKIADRRRNHRKVFCDGRRQTQKETSASFCVMSATVCVLAFGEMVVGEHSYLL